MNLRAELLPQHADLIEKSAPTPDVEANPAIGPS
jgi:hypothetical protein